MRVAGYVLVTACGMAAATGSLMGDHRAKEVRLINDAIVSIYSSVHACTLVVCILCKCWAVGQWAQTRAQGSNLPPHPAKGG